VFGGRGYMARENGASASFPGKMRGRAHLGGHQRQSKRSIIRPPDDHAPVPDGSRVTSPGIREPPGAEGRFRRDGPWFPPRSPRPVGPPAAPRVACLPKGRCRWRAGIQPAPVQVVTRLRKASRQRNHRENDQDGDSSRRNPGVSSLYRLATRAVAARGLRGGTGGDHGNNRPSGQARRRGRGDRISPPASSASGRWAVESRDGSRPAD